MKLILFFLIKIKKNAYDNPESNMFGEGFNPFGGFGNDDNIDIEEQLMEMLRNLHGDNFMGGQRVRRPQSAELNGTIKISVKDLRKGFINQYYGFLRWYSVCPIYCNC
jgi:hypothetical protein